jgi:hypothetical protein
MKTLSKLSDLTPDQANANKGSQRGLGMLEDSMRKYGAGRSILADKNGKIIAGNKTLERAAELNLDIDVVQSDGHKLVVVQRTDLDLDEDTAARQLAYADNRTAEVDLDWNVDQLRADAESGLDLSLHWTEDELTDLLGAEEKEVEVVTVPKEADVVWVLMAIPIEDWPKHQLSVEAMQVDAKYSGLKLGNKKV